MGPCGQAIKNIEVCDVIRRIVPEMKDWTLEGKPGSGIGVDVYGFDGRKAERVLSLKYNSVGKCTADEVRGFLELEKETGKV